MTDQAAQIAELTSDATREKVLSAAVARLTVEYNKNHDRGVLANLQAASKALEDFRKGAATANMGETFATQTAALEYLQRKWQIKKSRLSNDVNAGRVPKKDGYFTAKDLDFYAEAVHLKPKTIEYAPAADGSERLKSAMAEEREFRVGILKGEYINAAEEEARDAKLWFAVRTDLENHAPAIVNELINRVTGIDLPEEIAQRILALVPELRATYEDALSEIFDRYAKDGGIEA